MISTSPPCYQQQQTLKIIIITVMPNRILILLYLALCCLCEQQAYRTYLTGSWQVTLDFCPQQQFNNITLNTTIPTVLHLDLLRHNKIPDPFFGNNYGKLQWVSECNITYSKNITFKREATHIELVFQGIDTYSTIKLNGKQLHTTRNAFIEYRVKLSQSDIKDGSNLLEVCINSTKRYDGAADSRNHMPFVYAHSRKAAYQYSWDWAPNLNTLGIWKPVYVQYYNAVKIDYVWIRNRVIKNAEAVLNFAIAITHDEGTPIQSGKYKAVIMHNKKTLAVVSIADKYSYVDITIERPRLWWPNGIGEQNMYDFEIKLIHASNLSEIDNKTVPFGIRTVELDQVDKKFTVIINGYKVYCKGANYVPPDMFYPRTSNPDYTPGYTFQQLLHDAVESHYNMIRVWGGGQYESSEFLELASRMGIMLFYDFMFSDSIYPSTKEFLQNVEVEIVQQVRKARNYPALVLWSGNNEILQGIQSWGWSRENYQNDYKRLFVEMIPAILAKENPDMPYIASSPVNGVGNGGFQRGGDVHYWGVWAAGALFDSYKTAIGPFNSQFGTQAIPVWQTVINFTSPEHRSYTGAEFDAHQRHNSRFNTLTRYIRTYAHESKNFEHETYLSGLIQAYGVEIAIKHQRISKPKSYGTLYWQFNDAWPAISWSSIDYFGRWKPLQYMAKRLYPNVAVFCADGRIIAVNDNLHSVQAVVLIKVQNFNGALIYNKSVTITLAENQVKQLEEINRTEYQPQLNSIVVYTEIISGRDRHMSSTYFYVHYKQLKLQPTPKLFIKINQPHQSLTLRTDKFIKNLYISSTKGYIKLSDNYFDMIASKSYKIVLDGKYRMGEWKDSLVFRSYVQIHSDLVIDVVYQ